MAVQDEKRVNRSRSETHTAIESNPREMTEEMVSELLAAIDDELRAAIENAGMVLTERATIELADLNQRIMEFRNRLWRSPR